MRFALLFLTILLGVVALAPAQTLLVLGEEGPAMYTKTATGGEGLAWEVVQEIAKRTGQPVSVWSVVWATGYRLALERPNVVLFSMARTKERDPLFQWVGPFVDIQLGFFARKGSGLVVDSLEKARTIAKIGVYTDDISELWLASRNFTNLDRAKSAGGNAKKLLAGFLPVVASSETRMITELKEAGEAADSVELLYTYLTVPLYLAFSKSSDPALVKAWKKAFLDMRNDGTLLALLQHEYPSHELPPLDEIAP